MPDGTYTKAEVVAKIRATQPKSAGFSDDQIIDRLIKKAPEFAQKITDYSTEPTKPAQKQQDLPMFQQQYEATMKVGQAKPVTTEVEDFTAIQKKKEKANVLGSTAMVSGFNVYTPGATEQYQKNIAEAQKLDNESSKDLDKFNKTFNSSPLYTGLVTDSEKNLDKFRAKDVEGFDFVDQQKLREYIRTKVPQAANTGFETYLMNKLSGNLSYKMDEPKIMKKAEEIAKQKKISLPDNWMNIDKEYSKKAKDVSDNVSKQFDSVSSQAQEETTQLNNAYKSAAEGILNKYKNPEFQKNFSSEEELMQAYKQEAAASFDEYTKQFSNSKRKYNQLSQKLQSDYSKALNTLNVTGEKDAKKVADLLKEAVTSINDDKNATKFSMVGYVPTSGLPSGVTRFTSSFGRGLTGWLNSMASYIDMNSDSQVATSFRDFTANLSKKFENPNVKIDKAKDLLDINKVTAFTGDQLARMAPGLVTASVISGATGGIGIPAAIPILAGGTVGWLDQVMQATGDNYKTLIEQGLDPEEAKKRANRTYAGYLAAYPLTVFGMGGILGKYGAGSFIKRYGAGVAAEMITEVPEEIIQNEQDEAIAQNRKMDFGKMADLNNVYKTTLSVLPTIGLIGVPGAVRESSAAGEGFVPEWVSRVANAPVQSLSRNILMNGLYANAAALESMRHNGMITEEGSIQMKNKMSEIKADMDAARTAGLNRKQQSTYAGLMANVRTMEQSAAEIANQDMDATAKEEAVNKANKRLENSKQAAADFLKTKNGNYAEVYDKDGDRYIVSHDELNEMLEDKSFTQDVRRGDARVQLFYDKKAGDLLGNVSKRLLELNKDYSSGIREYNKSEQNTNALRTRLGIPTQPTSSTTIDGLIGQKGTFTLSRFPARVTTEGTLAVQNGKLVIEEDGGAITELGNASEFNGVAPSFIGMEFTPPKYTGPKMTQAEAKLPSLLAMYAGKIDPKTLVSLLGDMISDIKKPQLTKLVNAFDNAYQRKQQQKAINESLPKPQKLINVEPTEVGLDVDGIDVANTIAMVGDRNANTLTAKMLRIFSKPFISNSIDLDELHESSEEFRSRVEEVRGQKQGQYNQEFSNPENVPAVMVDGKIIDGMGRLAQLYVNGQKTATVFENTKIEQDATQASEREIEEGAEPSSISEYQGAEETGTQAETVQTSPSDSPVSSKGKIRIKTTPAFGKFTRENIDKLFNITGLSKMQRKVINDARKVFDAIDKLVSKGKIPLSIHVHSQSSFERAVVEAGGRRADAVARGFYMASDGSIHLNMDNIASDTMLHEGFHPILDYLQANNPAVINTFFKQLESIPEAAKIIKQAKELYKGTETQQKEAITDFVAGVADGRIVLNPSNFQKIKAFILDLLSKIGIGEGSILMDVNTELDLIKLAEFVTEKFTGGEAIIKNELSEFMKKDSDYVASNGRPISNRQAQFSLGNDFKDKKTKTTFTYIKNNDQFEKLKKAGFITEDKVLDDFIGKRMMLHSPDNAFTGIISKNGKILVEGKGGVFYPIRFHEDGYFWASTDNAANSMANTLNEMIESNGGKIYLALVSAPANKLLSSTTASNGVVEFFTRFSKDNIPGLSQESVIDQMIDAAAVVVEQKVKKQDKDGNDVFDKNGNPVYVLKNVGLGINIPKSKMVKGKSVPITIDAVKNIIAKKLSPQNSTFADRKLFALKLISNIAASIKKTNAEQYLGEFFTKGILNEAYKQQGKIENRYNLSAANITQSLSDMLSEPMLKNSNTGEVYAVLEIEGKVEPVKSDQHESYPMAIRSQVGNKTTLHILQEREKWEDRFADPETGRAVEEKRKLNVFPTSGVSATGLMLLEKTQAEPAFQKAPIKWEKSKEGKGDPSISSRNPIVAQAAKDLKEGKITNEEYMATVSKNSPITPITRFFEPATEEEIRRAVKENMVKMTNQPIQEDTVVGLRLDIPAYKFNNTWVVSVHEGRTDQGPILSYRNVGRITDVTFEVRPQGGLGIAAGKEKTTIARMYGNWKNVPGNTMEEQGEYVKGLVQDIVNDPSYVQVGMNPFRHSYFYDRSTNMGRPIVSADEVVQIGGLVYAKNPVYGNWTDEAYRVKNLFDAAGAPVQFQRATPTKSSYETVNKSALGRMLGDSERAKAIKRNLAKGIPIWQQWFTTFKKFGESITESNDYKVGYINKEVRKANKYVDQTISALKKSAKEGSPVVDKDVTAFMEGDQTALNNYPPYVAIAVTNMRMHIDALTDTLITFGAITDPAEIALFRSNKGKYFGRYYDLFINGKNDISLENIKDRLKNVDQSVIDAAKNVIRTEIRKSVERQNVGKTQDEIDTILERRVTDQIERILTGRENKFVKTPTQGSVNMRVLTERMDIKAEIRALMGEVENPLVRYYATIKKMSDLAAGVRYLNEFRTEGLGKFLFEQNDPNRPEGANFEISTENNPNLQPLGGLWTYKEFYDELTKNLEPESLNRFDQIAGKAFAASKYLKTVANPGTHAKNVISNVFIMINNGYMGVDLFNAIATLSTDAKFREQLLETLTESNVLSNNIGLQEINSFIKQNDDLDKIIADKFSDKSNKVKYSYEKVKGWLSGAYQFEDEIFKMLAFMVEAERYSNDIYGVTYKNLAASKKADVDEIISARIKNVMPTFSRVPAFVKAANKYLYLGAFMAYTAESVRIEKNNFMIAIKELSDPRTRATGGKRLAGMATLNYMFWSKTAGAGAAVGALATGAFTYGYSALQALMDDEDEQVKEQMSQREKDIRLWVREFSQSSDLASIKITDKGISYIDIGAYHPFGYRHKIMNRFDQLVRDKEEGVVMDAARALGSGLDPWIQPDFTVKAFLDALNNTDKYNKEISNSNDPSWKKTIDQSSYFIKESFSPGMVNNMIRAYKADQKGDTEKVKKSFQDILVREDDIEFTKSFFYKFKNEWDTKFSQANKYYNDAVSAGESPEAIQEAFNKSVDTKKRIIDDVVKYYQSAIRMGASAEEMGAIVEKMAPTNKIANMIKGDFKYTDYSDYVQPRD